MYEGERGEGNLGGLVLKTMRSKGEAGSETGSSSAAKWIEIEGTGDGGTAASIFVGFAWINWGEKGVGGERRREGVNER